MQKAGVSQDGQGPAYIVRDVRIRQSFVPFFLILYSGSCCAIPHGNTAREGTGAQFHVY